MANKDFFKKMTEQYHFSSTDNHIKKTKISPDKFLAVTYQESLYNCKKDNEYRKENNRPTKTCESFRQYKKGSLFPTNVNGIRKVFQGKKESKYGIPIPFLEFDACKRPIAHEGRHTMTALKSLGVKNAPVTIVEKKSLSRWEEPC